MVKLIEEDQVNGDKLRKAREAKGWDWVHVSRLCSLSVAQVKALENGGTDCFYSLSIKNNAARKVALVLGVSDVLDGTVCSPFEAFVEAIPTPPATDRPVLQALPPLATRRSNWIGYGSLSFTLVAVLLWSGLQMQSSLPDVRSHEFVGSVLQQEGSASSFQVAAVASTEKLATPPTTVQPQLALAPSPLPKPSLETEIVPASLATVTGPACAFEGEVAVLEAANPSKSAEKISLMLHKAGKLCVQDASGQVWQEELKPWMGRTFVGKAPWKLHSPVLPHADVYFQGEKLKLTSASARTIALNGKEIQ